MGTKSLQDPELHINIRVHLTCMYIGSYSTGTRIVLLCTAEILAPVPTHLLHFLAETLGIFVSVHKQPTSKGTGRSLAT